MNKSINALATIFILFSLLSCRSATPKGDAPTNDPALMSSMLGLKSEMDQLLPYLVSATKFKSPENQSFIKTRISTIERVSTSVTHAPAMNAQDPTLESLSRGFRDEIHQARQAYESGHTEYARTSLLNVTGYCIECHTRTKSGPTFNSNETQKTLTALRPLERGEYLLSVRQYDAALAEFEQVIKSGLQQGSGVFEVDRATRLALSITVRFESNPNASLRIVDDVLNSTTLPYYLKTTAQVWKRSLEAWKKESKKASRKDVIRFCQDLVQQGTTLRQGRDDRAGDIQLMRVQALLHPVLSTEKDPARLGQALYLMGVAYDGVKDISASNLQEDYFESCIRKSPHSDWSAICYRKLEETVLLGYTGSAGTSLPPEEQKRLDDLQKLAL